MVLEGEPFMPFQFDVIDHIRLRRMSSLYLLRCLPGCSVCDIKVSWKAMKGSPSNTITEEYNVMAKFCLADTGETLLYY